jgi:hypothetical protein
LEAQSSLVEDVGYSQSGQREEGEGSQDIEVKDEVAEIVGPRGSAIELRSSLLSSKDVVADDVPGHDCKMTVCQRIHAHYGDLRT